MGSAEEGGPAAKPPPVTLPPATTTAAATLPPVTKAEMPAVMSYNDWPSSVHAYYPTAPATTAAAGPFFSPPMHYYSAGQLMSPYVYSPMYTQGAMYTHPSISLGTPCSNTEPEGQVLVSKPKMAVPGKSGDGGKVTSGSMDDDTTHSGETGSEGSSDSRDEGLSASRKRTSSGTLAEGEATQAGAQYNNTATESSQSGRVCKLPVSAPGRATLPGPVTNLNIGMDLWNAPHARVTPVNIGPNAVNIAPTLLGREGVIPGQNQWMQLEERELKRQRRKQSNRESARRSRMRKQQECEELARKVAELTGENNALRIELEKVKKDSSEVREENASIVKVLESEKSDSLKEKELSLTCGHEGNGNTSSTVG